MPNINVKDQKSGLPLPKSLKTKVNENKEGEYKESENKVDESKISEGKETTKEVNTENVTGQTIDVTPGAITKVTSKAITKVKPDSSTPTKLQFTTNSVKELLELLKKIVALLPKISKSRAEQCIRLSIKNDLLILEILDSSSALYKFYFPVDVNPELTDTTGKIKKYIYPETLKRISKAVSDNSIRCEFTIDKELTISLNNYGEQVEAIYTDTKFPQVGFLKSQEWLPIFSIDSDIYTNFKSVIEISTINYVKLSIKFNKNLLYINTIGPDTIYSICKDLDSELISKYGKELNVYLPLNIVKNLYSLRDKERLELYVNNSGNTYKAIHGKGEIIFTVDPLISKSLNFEDYESLILSQDNNFSFIEVPSEALAKAINFQSYYTEDFKCLDFRVVEEDNAYYLKIKGPGSNKEARIEIISRKGKFADTKLQKRLLDLHLEKITKIDGLTRISQLNLNQLNIEELGEDDEEEKANNLENSLDELEYEESDEEDGMEMLGFDEDETEGIILDDEDEDDENGMIIDEDFYSDMEDQFYLLFTSVTEPKEGAPTVVMSNSYSY